jgi:hypothetical protein
MDRRVKKITRTIFLAIFVTASSIFYMNRGNDMLEIKFELEKNIHEVVKNSGAPSFSKRNIDGLISYHLHQPPPDVHFVYNHPFGRISVAPIFSFTLYADTADNNNLAVETASLMVDTDHLTSHEAALAFVAGVNAQFRQGRWIRYIPDTCPAVTGRSSYVDLAGGFEKLWSCPLDPDYKIPLEDWIKLMGDGKEYSWIRGNVIATLKVSYSFYAGRDHYLIFLEFEDFTIRKRMDEKREEEYMAEGDAKGWSTRADIAKENEERKSSARILEANAVKRGDQIVPREVH